MNTKKILLLTLLFASYIFLLKNSYNHVMAELNYEKSLNLIEESSFDKAESSAKKAVKYNSKEPRYFYNLAKTQLLNGAPKEETYNSIKTSINLNPNNLVTLRNVSSYFYFLALDNLDNIETVDKNFDPKYRSLAKEFLQQLKTKYPNDLGVQILIAKNEKRLEFTKDYLDTMKTISLLRTDILEWHPDLK